MQATKRKRFSIFTAGVFAIVAVATSMPVPAQPGGGKPDFSGIYFPAGRRAPNPLPYNDAAAALLEQYEQAFRTEDDPGKYCIWPGMPRAPWGAPFAIEIIHRPQDVTIYWEGYGMYRKIYMADHDPPEPILPSAMGHSVAHWEGDTLVVEITNLKPYPYMNRMATTSDAHVTERLRLERREVEGEMRQYLVDDLVLTDPKLYTEPVELHAEAQLRPDLDMLEYTCSVSLWEDYLLQRGLELPDVDALPMPD